jgi:Flp pilus assembly protein TadG
MTRPSLLRRARGSRGQSMVEFAMVLPVVMMIVLGVIEVSYALLDQHVVTKLAREGSNLISRDTTLQDAAAALRTMSSRPVNFDSHSRMILSVIKTGATTGTSNFNQPVLYERYEYGSLPAQSAFNTKGSGAFGPGPDYVAANSDSDTNLQVTNLPANVAATAGGMIYVTEIYTTHPLITPFDKFGITVPSTLYSVAYF